MLDAIGTRELVMFNRHGEHLLPSHAAWILELPPERLASNQGWYAARDAAAPHWKSFLYD